MPGYRHCTNLAAFSAEQIEADGGKTDNLVPCETLPGFYFDTVDSKFLRTLKDYRKNRFDDLEPAIRERLASEWKRSFDESNYTP